MKYEHNGKLITFEGCEGVGKSTQIRLLDEYLTSEGIDHIVTREPGGTAVSEKIRAILKDDSLSITDGTELLLFEASRRDNTERVVIPALREGKIVVVDRYTDSTLAYQAFGRGLDEDDVRMLNAYGSANVKIDLTLFIDEKPFANTSRGAEDRMENAGADFHERVYEGYKRLAQENGRIASIKTKPSAKETFADVLDVLRKRGIIS